MNSVQISFLYRHKVFLEDGARVLRIPSRSGSILCRRLWLRIRSDHRYVGNLPNGDTNLSAIRQVSDINPVQGASNPALNCGLSAQLATLVANANPGSAMAFNWSGGDFGLVRFSAVLVILDSC